MPQTELQSKTTGAPNMPSAKIAVIIPVFNRTHMVCKALDSIKMQTLPPHRLIVVDDASTDNTDQVISEKLDSMPFESLLLINEENMGASKSRNLGLEHTDGCEFIYFLDSDDYPPEQFLEIMAEKITSDPELVAVSTNRTVKYNYEHLGKTDDLSLLADNPWLWFMAKGAGIASCTLFRKDAIKKLGGFNPTLPTGHDTELFTRIANLGKWAHVPEYQVCFVHMGQTHLRSKYYDFLRRWALIYENCLYNFGSRRHVPKDTYATYLAERWLVAGIQLLRQKKFVEANVCFRKSLGWKIKSNLALIFLMLSSVLRFTPGSGFVLRILSDSTPIRYIFKKV